MISFRYRERLKQLADLAADQPMTGLQKTVWWTEYVLRHNDTSHLKAPWATSRFYHEFQLDVVAVLSTVLLILMISFYVISKVIVKATLATIKITTLRNCVRRFVNVGFRLAINKVSP